MLKANPSLGGPGQLSLAWMSARILREDLLLLEFLLNRSVFQLKKIRVCKVSKHLSKSIHPNLEISGLTEVKVSGFAQITNLALKVLKDEEELTSAMQDIDSTF